MKILIWAYRNNDIRSRTEKVDYWNGRFLTEPSLNYFQIEKKSISLPAPSLPEFSMFFDVIQDAIIIALVSFASSISVADTFARKHNYKIDSNKVMRLKHFYPLRATNKWNFWTTIIKGIICIGHGKCGWFIFEMFR